MRRDQDRAVDSTQPQESTPTSPWRTLLMLLHALRAEQQCRL
jgi:hypothetical protein